MKNANQEEEKIDHLAPAKAYTHYNVQSPLIKAVRARLVDPYDNALALEPSDVNYANQDEEKIDHLAPVKAYTHYNVQSTQDNAVKAWLVDPWI